MEAVAASETPSLTDLKIQELLKEVRVKYPTSQNLSSAIAFIRECLQQIPEHQVSFSLASSFVENLGVPAEKAEFTFRSPESIEIVGSFALQTAAMPSQTIDVVVQMPKSCFRAKDFLNYQYHAKRALYLAALQKHLARNLAVKRTLWTSMHHDGRKPLLLVQLDGDKLGFQFEFSILIVPVIGRDVFDISKLVPPRHNLRKIINELHQEATPYYNSSILEDMCMQANCAYLQTMLSQNDRFKDAILLLKVWMRQRGLMYMADSFNGFLISMLFAYVVANGEGKITRNMSPFQIFRIIIEMLAGDQFMGKHLFLKSKTSDLQKEGRKNYAQHFDAVILDTMGSYNMAFRVTKNALEEMKEMASRTIDAMKNSSDSGFEEVFMTAIDFSLKFDYHARISVENDSLNAIISSFEDKSKYRDVESLVEDVIKKGLSDRASLVRVYRRLSAPVFLMEEGENINRPPPIYIGIKANSFETAYRMVDIGPSADNTDEAMKFRSFWGEKAELRRFKDGTIKETAVWECDSTQRHLIIKNIILHLLQRHLSISSSDIFIAAGQLDFVLMEGTKDPSASIPKLFQAFDILSKRIREIEELPLKITSVQPLHPAFRHSAVFPPQVNILADERPKKKVPDEWIASCADPCDIMIQLEGSGRWPTNQDAIEKMKLAFSLQIADSVKRLHGIQCIASEHYVDLLMHGFCFRLKIHYDKDPTFVQKRTNKHDSFAREAVQSPPCLTHRKDFLHMIENDLMLHSLHASMLSGLQGRYPVYGPTVRLAKRWVASHLFCDFLREEAVELLVAYTFVKPAPFSVPLSRITGLLRFLQLLKSYDWALSPLIVDLNGDITSKEHNFISNEFKHIRSQEALDGLRKLIGQPAMYIATPYDLKSLTWTAMSPNSVVLRRLTSYAKTSADLLIKLIKGETLGKWPSLFRTPLNLYDIVLKLQPTKVPHPLRVLFPPDINVAAKVVVKSCEDGFTVWHSAATVRNGHIDVEKQLFIGFDPLQCMVEDLKSKFGDLFSYWYDNVGSTMLAVNWNSRDDLAKKRKRVNEDDLLIEISKLGEGFIESIHVMASS